MSIYFDWAATALPDTLLQKNALELSFENFGNPSSIHDEGKKSAQLLKESREVCAQNLGIKQSQVYFTGGGTEANHLPLLALLQRPIRGSIAISALEHPSMMEQAKMLEHTGWKLIQIPSSNEGFISPEAVISSLKEDTAYVAVMAVNNETGAIQPTKEIAQALIDYSRGKKKPHFHVDAVQAIGKIPYNLNVPGLDSASLSAHKLGGFRGSGILYLEHRIEPFIRGGGQESAFRPGTENLMAALALSECLKKSINQQDFLRAEKKMEYLIQNLSIIKTISLIPETRKPIDPRFSPWILQCTNTKYPGEVLVRILADKKICISTGSACSSRKKSRPILQAMNVKPQAQQNAFRISIGHSTTEAEIDTLIKELFTIL